MAELAILADKQLTVYPEEVTHQLHVMAQARESSPVIDRRSNQLCYGTNQPYIREKMKLKVKECFVTGGLSLVGETGFCSIYLLVITALKITFSC